MLFCQAGAAQVEPAGDVVELQDVDADLCQLLNAAVPQQVVLGHAHARPAVEPVRGEERLHALAPLHRLRLQQVPLQADHELLDGEQVDLAVGGFSRQHLGAHRGCLNRDLDCLLVELVERPELLLVHLQGGRPCRAAEAHDQFGRERDLLGKVLAEFVDADLLLPSLEPGGFSVPFGNLIFPFLHVPVEVLDVDLEVVVQLALEVHLEVVVQLALDIDLEVVVRLALDGLRGSTACP